jgi:hypothetical protein
MNDIQTNHAGPTAWPLRLVTAALAISLVLLVAWVAASGPGGSVFCAPAGVERSPAPPGVALRGESAGPWLPCGC